MMYRCQEEKNLRWKLNYVVVLKLLFNVAAQSLDLNVNGMVFFYNLHSDLLLAAKKPRGELPDMVMKCWAENLEGKLEDVWHCLNYSSQIISESGCDNDYKHRCGSHISNAAGDELGDLQGQAVPQRFFATAEDKMKPEPWAEYERGDNFVFQRG